MFPFDGIQKSKREDWQDNLKGLDVSERPVPKNLMTGN